ncbi:MAG TPA: hypothetical protein VIH71_15430 [Solirubrobacteraceae bacterium]
MSSLIERLIAVHDALDQAKLPHAIGGAIALGYCIQEPRGTRDLDVNIFVTRARADDVFAALPDGITVTLANVEQVQRDGQTRLMWDDMPVDIFLNVLPFHDEVATGVRSVVLAGRTIPVLDCSALIVFKAMFDRSKDWVDIEAMVEYGSIDVGKTAGRIADLDGPDSRRAQRLRDLAAG